MRHWILIGGLLVAPAGHAAVRVRDIALTPNTHGWRLRVNVSDTSRYTLHTYPEPARLIVDIPNATLVGDSRIAAASVEDEPTLRYSQFSRSPDAVRVVVNLPAGTAPWRQVSASPASEIVVDIPGAGVAAQKLSHHRSIAVQPSRSVAGAHPSLPVSMSAQELEKRQLEADEHQRIHTYGPSQPKVRAGSTATVKRSRLASRGGEVNASDVMVDPAAAPAPAWDPEDAVALIRKSECPAALRQRLVDVVSDPAIQTSRYVWGAQTPGQFDCSGLALYIYDAVGVKLPRCSWQQCTVGEAVDRGNLRAGDLVFFNTRGNGVSHVGIYLGDGRFLHAANPKSNLRITSLDAPYYAVRYVCARRVYGAEASPMALGG